MGRNASEDWDRNILGAKIIADSTFIGGPGFFFREFVVFGGFGVLDKFRTKVINFRKGCSAFISSLARDGLWQAAFQMFCHLHNFTIKATVVTISAMLTACDFEAFFVGCNRFPRINGLVLTKKHAGH